MKAMEQIVVYKDFSDIPGPRFISEGSNSGQEFREKVLFPKLKLAMQSKSKLLIDLDGTNGYGNSFLEEAFGGLIREHSMKEKDIIEAIEIKSEEEPHWKDKVIWYIQHANKSGKKNEFRK